MKDIFVKIYIYIILINALVNLTFGLIHYLNQNFITVILLTLISLPELLIVPVSIALIIYVLVSNIKRIYLILPVFFLVAYLGMFYWGLVQGSEGVDLIDLSIFTNLIVFFITAIFYVVQIVMGVYLLVIKK